MSYEQGTCAWPPCGCTFTRKVADRKRGWAKCCSKSCAAKLRTYGPAKKHYRAAVSQPQKAMAPAEPMAGPEFDFDADDTHPFDLED